MIKILELHGLSTFCEISDFLRFLRFLDFCGPGCGPGGARKGPPRGPPRELWVVRKSGKPLPPVINQPVFNAPVINKRGPPGGPGRAPFFRQAAFPVFVIFLISQNSQHFLTFSYFQWVFMKIQFLSENRKQRDRGAKTSIIP